jgi:hypothetical protein
VSGYFIIECESRDEAIEIARRCPHAKVGPVEVREVMPVGYGVSARSAAPK